MKKTENRLDDIEELFDKADQNRDDDVTLTEFRGLMLELDRHMLDNVVLANFLQIDTNGDGRIGFAEFRSWWLSN
jgi:Ca2+-binding EF-hand superfamily protein